MIPVHWSQNKGVGLSKDAFWFCKIQGGKTKNWCVFLFWFSGFKKPTKNMTLSFELTFKQNVKWSQRPPRAEIPKEFCILTFWSDLEVLSNLSFGEENERGKNDLRSLSGLVHGKAADIWSAGMHKEIIFFLAFFFFPSLFYGSFLNLSHSRGFCFAARGTCRLVLSLEQSLLRHSCLTQHHTGSPDSVLEKRDLGKEGCTLSQCWVVVGCSGLLGVQPGADSSLWWCLLAL